MKGSANRLYWLAFGIIAAGFVIAKLQDVSLPYFWDELGVYAPGALRMKDTGHIGLMPHDLIPLYSRGHPLLGYAIYALAFKLFGDTVIVGHCCTLFIALCTLLATFLFAKKVFGPKTALGAALLLCVQPVFYAMSAIVLPEMLVTLLMVVAVWGFATKRWWLYLAGACLGILTKESSIVLPASALFFLFIESLFEKDFFTLRRWKWAFISIIPILLFACFLLIQKRQNGWYLFPLHVGYSCYDPRYFIPRFFRLCKYPVFQQGRWLLASSAIIGAFICCLFPYREKTQNRAIHLMSLLFISAVMFSAMNYFLPRYIVFLMPFIAIGGVHFAVSFSEQSWPVLGQILVPFFCIAAFSLAVSEMDNHEWADTWNMSYKHLLHCEKTCINWAETQSWHDSTVETNFPVFQALADKRNGFLKQQSWPYSENWQRKTSYAILYHIEGKMPVIKADSFLIIKQFKNNYATFSVMRLIYKK